MDVAVKNPPQIDNCEYTPPGNLAFVEGRRESFKGLLEDNGLREDSLEKAFTPWGGSAVEYSRNRVLSAESNR
jgi:hypothetical protein